MHNASPGLDVCAVLVVVCGDAAHCDVFKYFELALELADAAKRYSSRSVERAVLDEDVGAV